MNFQIVALPYAPFAAYFDLSSQELEARNARRMVVDACPGTPCRVSFCDAQVGETVVLLNYEHLPQASPYRSRHAIFVRQGAVQARPEPGEVPEVLSRRLLSVRAFDQHHLMQAAEVVEGEAVAPMIKALFANPAIDYLHLHNAGPGCFAAAVLREPAA